MRKRYYQLVIGVLAVLITFTILLIIGVIGGNNGMANIGTIGLAVSVAVEMALIVSWISSGKD